MLYSPHFYAVGGPLAYISFINAATSVCPTSYAEASLLPVSNDVVRHPFNLMDFPCPGYRDDISDWSIGKTESVSKFMLNNTNIVH